MRQALSVPAVLIAITLLAGCAASTPPMSTSTTESVATTSSKDAPMKLGNVLVVYFSQPETSDPENMTEAEEDSTVVVDGEVLGNTQYLAFTIQRETSADIFRIETVEPYPLDHKTLVDQATAERQNNARPQLSATVESLEKYDTIFLGYPIWWADMPMALYTFLENNDLAGKRIIPFNAHGGSGLVDTIDTIAELQPDATVERNGLTISRDDIDDSAEPIRSWLSDVTQGR